jgi:hypothetical protein
LPEQIMLCNWARFDDNRPPASPMPQIDFGQAFSTPDDGASSTEKSSTPGASQFPHASVRDVESSKFRRTRLGRSELTNIIFAIIAVLGGLFCAFYFFNGAELLRGAVAWPREFLYPQPASPAQDGLDRARLAATLGVADPSEHPSDRSGDPFSRANNLLTLDPPPLGRAAPAAAPGTPGLPAAPPVPGPGSLLSQLGSQLPGGDALLQTFNRGVAEIGRISQVDAQRTVVLVETKVVQTARQTAAKARNTLGNTQNTVGNVSGQVAGTQTAASSTAGSLNNSAARATNVGGGTMNGGGTGLAGLRGGLGGLGGSGGLGGLGGLGGAGRGVGVGSGRH